MLVPHREQRLFIGAALGFGEKSGKFVAAGQFALLQNLKYFYFQQDGLRSNETASHSTKLFKTATKWLVMRHFPLYDSARLKLFIVMKFNERRILSNYGVSSMVGHFHGALGVDQSALRLYLARLSTII